MMGTVMRSASSVEESSGSGSGSRAARAEALDYGSPCAPEGSLAAHVVRHVALRSGFELFGVEDVLTLEARDEAGLLDVLHRAAQLAVREVLVAGELDVPTRTRSFLFTTKVIASLVAETSSRLISTVASG